MSSVGSLIVQFVGHVLQGFGMLVWVLEFGVSVIRDLQRRLGLPASHRGCAVAVTLFVGSVSIFAVVVLVMVVWFGQQSRT